MSERPSITHSEVPIARYIGLEPHLRDEVAGLGGKSSEADTARHTGACTEVVVRQTDGLGNQLFQYAAGRSLAKKYGATLRIAHELPRNLTSSRFARPILLQKFSIAANLGPATSFDRLVLSTRPRFALPSWMARRAKSIQVIREKPDAFIVYQPFAVEAWAHTVYLLGYWQAHPIVDFVDTELRTELSLREAPGEMSRGQAQRITAAKTPISVHIRRGDYLLSINHKALPSDYYERSVQLMREHFPDCTFFVFSDDAKFAHEWCAERPGFVVVDHNNEATAHEDLWLMSLCQHHVIANSTFSWWGAWLNARDDKRVIAPASWLGFRTAETDIAPSSWWLV